MKQSRQSRLDGKNLSIEHARLEVNVSATIISNDAFVAEERCEVGWLVGSSTFRGLGWGVFFLIVCAEWWSLMFLGWDGMGWCGVG